jgi:hypothetical protein
MPDASSSRLGVRDRSLVFVLVAVLLIFGCATPDPGASSEELNSEEMDRSARDVLMLGPDGLEGAHYRLMWGMTIGVATSLVWGPWIAYDVVSSLSQDEETVIVVRGPEGYFRLVDRTRDGSVDAAPNRPGAPVPEIDFGRYHALVIGNDEYRHLKKLVTAVSDARAIAWVLKEEYGFKTTVLENATRSELISALFEYRAKLGPGDNLLIYYAGHGQLDPETEEGYWLPVDSRKKDPTHWFANSTISTMLKGIDAKHVLLIADSCFSGSLSRSVFSRSRRSDYIETLNSKRARVVMTSGGMEPVLDSGGEGHSVFAKYLLRALRANGGVIDGSSVFLMIRQSVVENAHQTPEYGPIRFTGHDGGDFLFVKRAEPSSE